MDISDIKQTKFFVSHVWPGMIDIKCSKCGKLATTLQNRDVELVGKKVYITKKDVSCSSCRETIPEGMLIAENEQCFDKLIIDDSALEVLKSANEEAELYRKKRDEEIDRARRKLEEARRIKAAHTNMITTTCSNIEGRRIKEYKGIISGASVYNFGGFIGSGYSDKGQSELFGAALKTAKEILIKNAVDVGVDAVIGIQTALVVTNPLIAVTLTGTAVKTEKITEDK